VRLDIDVPIYRIANIRTRIEQMKYVSDYNKPADFFKGTQENESVQQVQHDILVKFAKKGRADSISPIIEDLESEGQREALLVSAAGVVVNGNRRLAAMRELFAERPRECRHFSHVDCAVLPTNITEQEVMEVEVQLQMRPETKLPYGWVNESLAIQELLENKRTVEQIASLMNKRKVDIERALGALIEAKLYLADWLGTPEKYQNVEDAGQFFNDLTKGIKGKTGEALEISRRIAWGLVSSKNLGRRVYDYNFSFGKGTDKVVSELTERLGIELTAKSVNMNVEPEALEIDLEEDEGTTSLQPLIESFDDNEQRTRVLEELIAVCESIREQDKQIETGRRALASIQAANNKLYEVDFSTADKSTYSSIDSQLDSVIKRAEKLREDLQLYMK